jgi:type II secretory pathway component PulF
VSRNLRNVISKIRTDVAAGSTLAQAFGRHPHVFNELYVSMLKTGEEAGILEKVLSEVVKLMEKEEEIKKGIKAATLYPKIVIVVLVIAVTVLMVVVAPKFVSFYKNYNAELPFVTQLLISVSNAIRSYWPIVLAGILACFYAYKRYYATKSGRLKIDEFRFRLPVLGELTSKVVIARFSRILASLYKSGLPMPRSIEVVSNVIGNEAFAFEVRKLGDAIQKGSTMADAMVQLKYFSPVLIETTAVGERTGALDEMLSAIADHYELEVSHSIKNLTTLLEPILLIVIFGMVAFLALAIFLPIWSLSSVVK